MSPEGTNLKAEVKLQCRKWLERYRPAAWQSLQWAGGSPNWQSSCRLVCWQSLTLQDAPVCTLLLRQIRYISHVIRCGSTMLTSMSHEGCATKTQNHHCPGGGLGNGRGHRTTDGESFTWKCAVDVDLVNLKRSCI